MASIDNIKEEHAVNFLTPRGFLTKLKTGVKETFFPDDPYSSFVPPIVYAIFGSSRQLAVGTFASGSLLIYQTLSTVVKPEDDPILYLHLVYAVTFVAGAFQACLGLLRLGILVDFVSNSTITGFVAGAAVMLCLQQLKGIFGLKHFVTKTDLITVMRGIWTNSHERKRNPRLFWVSAIGPMTTVIVGAVFTYLVKGQKHGIQIVGPFSKTAVNYNAGCKTAMTNIIQAFLLALILQYLAPLFGYTPLVALSAIIVSAVLGLIDYTQAIHLYKVDKFDFIICMAAFLGVTFVAMDFGLMLSLGLGLVRAALYVARPGTCRLGKLPDVGLYRDVEHYTTSTFQGVLIVQLGSPIHFANSNYVRERMIRYVRDEQDSSGDTIEHIIVDLSGVTSIDTTAIEGLLETKKIFEKNEIQMSFVNPKVEVLEKLILSNFVDMIGKESFFLTLDDAVKASQYTLRKLKTNGPEEAIRETSVV
ncbi:unnamed protein product [Lupinus luteus]|uniref:STAS domain-containing protein n=1 Tax=Lupinus luteus TaxID=3873 RepID=A0AAV1WSQ3_LUPLU